MSKRKSKYEIYISLSKKQRKGYLIALLMSNVHKKQNGCWLYQGRIHNGYGVIYLFRNKKDKQESIYAHRLAYMLFVGKIRKDMFICHKCNNPKCCNPEHLYQGTQKDNMQDMVNAHRQYITWGERSGRHKLTTEQIQEIRNSNDRQIDLAMKYNVSKSNINMIVHYKSRCYE
jgi:hypothetical protein